MTGSVQMTTKLSRLQAEITAVLEDHPYGDWNVETRVRDAILNVTSRDGRLRVMSPDYDPDVDASSKETRYVRIAWIGDIGAAAIPDAINAGGIGGRFAINSSLMMATHTFRVMMYYTYEDNASVVLASQTRWDNLLEKDDGTDPQGLLAYLREVSSFGTTPNITLVSAPRQVILPEFPVTLAGSERDFVHYCEFVIQLT